MSLTNIKLYHLENSKSFRVMQLLELIKLPYELIYLKRLPNLFPPPELKQVHPIGASPVLTFIDEKGNNVVFAESGAIIEFLIARYAPHLAPNSADTAEYTQYLAWMHFSESTYMQMNFLQFCFSHIRDFAPSTSKEVADGIYQPIRQDFIEPRVHKHLQYMEDQLRLNGPDYFVGNKLSGADFMLYYCVESGSIFFKDGKYPTLQRWHANWLQQDFVQASIKKAGGIDFSPYR